MASTSKPEDFKLCAVSPGLAVLVLGLCAAAPVAALNIGAPQTQSALFQPLRLVFPVQLLPGESLSPDCVKAVLVAGETRLPADQVQVQLQGRTEGEVSAVRVSSLVPIDEPLVNVSLSLGCPTRYTRQFTALIDPVATPARADAQPAVLEGDELYSPALRAALGTAGAKPAELLAQGRPVPSGSTAAGSLPVLESREPAGKGPEEGSARAGASAPPVGEASHAAARPQGKAARARPTPAGKTKPPTLAEAASPAAPMPGKAPTSRLQLEASELLSAAPAPVTAPSSSAAPAVQESQQRVRELETELARMRAEGREVQDALKQLSAQLRKPQGVDRSWLLMLAGISLLLAVACAWLFMQLQSLRRATHEAWWAHLPEPERAHRPPSARVVGAPGMAEPVQAPAPTVQDAASAFRMTSSEDEDAAGRDFLNSELQAGDDGTGPAPFITAAEEAAPGEEAVSVQLLDMPQANTDLQPLQTLPERAVAEGVSVEELIDLEQQVDFFMVLGQQEAAIHLLSQRLHEKGRHTALPYLKLLEILQRHGDQAGFERVAREFADRFHAQAPVWSTDIAAGEGLLAYAEATELIMQSWRDAAMTMQLIQTLLAHGDPDGHAFTLAAYRDILMLYAVARDISEREVRGEDIDLFLPLDASRQGSPSHMMATMPWQRPGGPAPAPGPVDLDLDLSKDGAKG